MWHIFINIKNAVGGRTIIFNYTHANGQEFLHKDKQTNDEWLYRSTGEYQICIVPVSRLGYTSGVVEGISFTNHQEASLSLTLEWIEYVTLDAGLTEAQALSAYNTYVSTRNA